MNPNPQRILCLWLCLALALASTAGCGARQRAAQSTPPSASADDASEVELVLFLMARCPHSAKLLRHLLPLQREFGHHLPLSVAFIGTVDDNGRADLAHGEAEIQSAQMLFCAGMASDPTTWRDFMTCLYQDDTWHALPGGWETCAETHRIDTAKTRDCMVDGTGEQHLRQSIETAAAEGIFAAPMLFINGRPHIGTSDPEHLRDAICHAFDSASEKPAPCASATQLPQLLATLLNDSRCADLPACDVHREMNFLQALMPSMQVTALDYATDDGQEMFAQMAAAAMPIHLPVLWLPAALDDLPSARRLLDDSLMRFRDGYLLPLGPGYDPTVEICDNGIDDNGDGLVDCEDPTCAALPICRPPLPERVDLFIMSQCPHGMMMLPFADHFLKHMKGHGTTPAMRVQFIGLEEDGALHSLHGPDEVAENQRMLCVQELYAEGDAFMDYMLCRARNFRSNDWQSCLSATMKPKAITACAEGPRGRELLSASFALADEVGVTGSPTWLINTRQLLDIRSSSALFEAFCAENEPAAACETPIRQLLIEKQSPGPGPGPSCR